jgi:hypothetical protein
LELLEPPLALPSVGLVMLRSPLRLSSFEEASSNNPEDASSVVKVRYVLLCSDWLRARFERIQISSMNISQAKFRTKEL